MERPYSTGTKSDISFFVGEEIERTPAYGKQTLFVVGIHNAEKIAELAKTHNCDHIYLGANHSYAPMDYDQVMSWELMALELLKRDLWVTLDIDHSSYKWSEDLIVGLCCFNNFIPMISVKIPYITNLNYNACVKVDDRDFNATNPGVWVHHVHDLMDRKKFTNWTEYTKDLTIE